MIFPLGPITEWMMSGSNFLGMMLNYPRDGSGNSKSFFSLERVMKNHIFHSYLVAHPT